MDAPSRGDELIEVVVRLPRKAIEDTLLSGGTIDESADQRRLAAAKALMAGRRRRSTCFGGVRFYDPSWDMILELYIAAGENRALAVSQLCELSGGSTTTALRHLEHLEAIGMLARAPDPSDRRRIIVSMLPALSHAWERWLDLQMTASHLGL